jgi:hypothetical protein
MGCEPLFNKLQVQKPSEGSGCCIGDLEDHGIRSSPERSFFMLWGSHCIQHVWCVPKHETGSLNIDSNLAAAYFFREVMLWWKRVLFTRSKSPIRILHAKKYKWVRKFAGSSPLHISGFEHPEGTSRLIYGWWVCSAVG